MLKAEPPSTVLLIMALLVAIAASGSGCGDDPPVGLIDEGLNDARDAGAFDGPSVRDGALRDGATTDVKRPPLDGPKVAPDAPPPKPLPRGLAWVRDNPMFVSALVVSLGVPSRAAVDDYFKSFKANAAHFWQTGLPAELAGWRKHAGATMRFLSWVDKSGISSANQKIIGGIAANMPGRIGYQVGDEPLTWQAYMEMVAGAQKVRKADPQALIVFNYTYNLGKDLDRALEHAGTKSEQDVYSYDVYTRRQGAYEHLARYRRFGLKHRRPYWRYIRGYLPSGSSKDKLDESDARWDAFSGLVYGYTGHSWFLYQVAAGHKLTPVFFAAAGSYAAAKTAEFAMVAKINVELRNLGRAITQLVSQDVRYNASLGFLQPTATTAFSPGAGGDRWIKTVRGAGGANVDYLIGFFRDVRGEQVVMLQNVAHRHGSFPVNLNLKPITYEIDFDFSGAPSVDRNKVLTVDRLDGKVKTLALVPLGGSRARLRVTLAAGDPILFKYATGKSFLLGK